MAGRIGPKAAEKAVDKILEILYRDDETGAWDENKEWEANDLSLIAEVLQPFLKAKKKE